MVDFGTDIGTTFNGSGADMSASGVEVSGRLLLAQALARRLLTPRGRLIDDPDYGYDLVGEFNDDLDASDLARIRASIENELSKDERVVGITATVTLLAGLMTVSIIINDSSGPFNLVLGVTAVSATILTIGQ